MHEFTNAELEAYLDESLASEKATELEKRLRDDEDLLRRLSAINGRREAGMHTLGEVWRRNQLGVPTSEQMGQFLLGVLPQTALRDDMKAQGSKSEESTARRSKIYKSSAGLLKKSDIKDE